MPRAKSIRPRPPGASGRGKAAKRASLAQWDAMLARYPLGSPLDLISQGMCVVAANAFVLKLLWTRRMQPFDLVLLVALEALVLTTIAHLQNLFVPASALMEKRQPLKAKLGIAAFGFVWLAGVYGIFLGGLLGSGPQILAAARDPWRTLESSGLLWPLAITALGAGVDAARDGLYWRARGGYFLSTPGFSAGARWLTLFLGGIPFFIPLAALFFGGVALLQRVSERFTSPATTAGATSGRTAGRWLAWVGPGLALLFFGSISGVVGLFQDSSLSAVEGWAIAYCLAKLLSEGFVAFLPLIASRARAEEAAALGIDAPATNRPG